MKLLERIRKYAETPPAYFAPGIPVRGKMRALPDLRAPRTFEFGVQEHRAARAGLHTDFRISDGKTAFSWAIRKGIPPPGVSHLAVRQQDHHPSYLRWEGTITDPYGKGEVKLQRAGLARVLCVSPEKINLDVLDSRKGSKPTLIHTPRYGENRWILVNRTPTTSSRPDVPIGKQKFKEKNPEELGQYRKQRYKLSRSFFPGVISRFGKKKVPCWQIS